jgi:hypothetical protein
VNQACPTGFNTTRSLQIAVTAHVSSGTLQWRRASTSSDILTPSSGAVATDDTTTLLLSDLVLDNACDIEVVNGKGKVLLSVSVRNN